MLVRFLIVIAIVAVAVFVAQVVQRRRAVDPPTQRRHTAPSQLDRVEFEGAERAWLVAVFTSDTCATCATVVDKARVLESASVAVDIVSFQRDRGRHDRYGIDAVPMTLIADVDGVVAASFVGPMSATDLWAAMADAREPGSVTRDGCGSAPY